MESHPVSEREVCEMVPGRVFTNNYNENNYPNCLGCNCCIGINFFLLTSCCKMRIIILNSSLSFMSQKTIYSKTVKTVKQ